MILMHIARTIQYIVMLYTWEALSFFGSLNICQSKSWSVPTSYARTYLEKAFPVCDQQMSLFWCNWGSSFEFCH